jgi:hypothetical protein
MAVAIWDHQPTAQELLERRIARGWRPTPTATRDGDIVLGFAACGLRPGRRAGDVSGSATDRELPGQDHDVLGGDGQRQTLPLP